MAKPPQSPVLLSPLAELRRFTTARIALGRAGTSLPTQAQLEFQFAHARARDAVHHPLGVAALQAALAQRGRKFMTLHSAAGDRQIYLQRPDQGRRLHTDSLQTLRDYTPEDGAAPDVAFVVADGLSAIAVERSAVTLLDLVLPMTEAAGWRAAPIAIVEQGRVAIGDEIGETLRAGMVAILIGERPGLSSPASMGIYLTYAPRVATTDAGRNCISNVHPDGMSCEDAARKLFYLMSEARRRGLSGVMLKDESEPPSRQLGRAGN